MPRFVPQSAKRSDSKSAQTRTAYLATLVDEVDRLIKEYVDAHPGGIDVTLYVLVGLGEQVLQKFAVDRTFETVKQDVGRLIAIRLVAIYGEDHVMTWRKDDGEQPCGRPPKKGFPDWLGRYTPHVVVPGIKAMRIVLDTNVVRHLAQGDDFAIDLDELNATKALHPVSIAEPALGEIIIALNDGRLTFEDWAAVVGKLSPVLDPDLPVAPMGRDAAVMSGLIAVRGYDTDRAKAFYRAFWAFLASCRSTDDFNREMVFKYPDGREFTLGPLPPAHVRKVAEEHRQQWAGFIHGHAKFAPAGSVEDMAENVRGSLLSDVGTRGADRLALAFRAIAIYGMEAIKGIVKEEEFSNDAFDYDVLFATALPAIICTHDKRLVGLAKRTETGASWQVMSPDKLLDWLAKGN